MHGVAGFKRSDRALMGARPRPHAPSSWAAGLAILIGSLCLGSPAFADYVDPSGDEPSVTISTSDGSSPNGYLVVDILVPNTDLSLNPLSGSTYTADYTNSSNQSTSPNFTLVSNTGWTSTSGESLAQYLASNNQGISSSASPSDSFSDFAETGVSSFYVYQVDLGWTTLSSYNPPTLSISSNNLPPGSYITAFLNTGAAPWAPNWIATAANNAFMFAAVPEPSSLALLAAAVLGLWLARRRQKFGAS
jgi:hypothetical protein